MDCTKKEELLTLDDVEREALQYLKRHWATVAYATTADSPFQDPYSYSRAAIVQYCAKVLAGLADTRHSEHLKFQLLVRRYQLCAEVLEKESRPGGRLSDHGLAVHDILPSQRPLKLDQTLTAAKTTLMQSKAFGELRKAYQQYLTALYSLGGFRSHLYVDVKKDNAMLAALVERFPLTHAKSRSISSGSGPGGASGAAGGEDATGDDLGDELAGSPATSNGQLPVAAALQPPLSGTPDAVMHRWWTSTSSALLPHQRKPRDPLQCLNTQEQHIDTLGSVIRRTFLLRVPSSSTKRNREAAGETCGGTPPPPPPDADSDSSDGDKDRHVTSAHEFTVDIHRKMMEFHVVWLAPQPQAPTVDTPFSTVKEQSKLAALSYIAERKLLVEAYQRAMETERSFSVYCELHALIGPGTPLGVLGDQIYALDVASGSVRQREGAAMEEKVWQTQRPLLIRRVILPVHLEYLARTAAEHAAATNTTTAATTHYHHTTATTINDEYRERYDAQAWIEKCLDMSLEEEEDAMARAHPEFQEWAEASRRVGSDGDAGGRSSSGSQKIREAYAAFRVFSTYIAKLPFYHLVDESALSISVVDLPGKNSPPECEFLWKTVGELDGLLIDLNHNEVLACFEIKSNPADIGKAALQGIRFSAMISDAFHQKPVTTPSSASSPAAQSSTTSAKGHAKRRDSSGGGCRGSSRDAAAEAEAAAAVTTTQTGSNTAAKVLISEVMVSPRRAPTYSQPFYDSVFPLYSSNFFRKFSPLVDGGGERSWYIVTTIPVKDWNGTAYEKAPSIPLPCEVPPFVVPSQGRGRHVLVDAMALLLVQSTLENRGGKQRDVSGDGSGRTLHQVVQCLHVDSACALAAARRMYAVVYAKMASEPLANAVLTRLLESHSTRNLVLLERQAETMNQE